MGTVMSKLAVTQRLLPRCGFSILIVKVRPSGMRSNFTFSAISSASSLVGAWTEILAVTLQSVTSAPVTSIEPKSVRAIIVVPFSTGAVSLSVRLNFAWPPQPMFMQPYVVTASMQKRATSDILFK